MQSCGGECSFGRKKNKKEIGLKKKGNKVNVVRNVQNTVRNSNLRILVKCCLIKKNYLIFLKLQKHISQP